MPAADKGDIYVGDLVRVARDSGLLYGVVGIVGELKHRQADVEILEATHGISTGISTVSG